MLRRSKIIFWSAFATTSLSASALFAQAEKPPLWPQASYSLMELRGDGDVEKLVQRALAAAPQDAKVPLLQGWLWPNVFAQIHSDHHVMYSVVGNGAEQQVCRITVSGLPNTAPTPATFAVGRGYPLWCQEPGKADNAPTPSQVRARWPRGRLVRTARFTSADGKPLAVSHIVADNNWVWPLPPQKLADVTLLTFLPKSRTSSTDLKRQLFLMQLANGRWALSFRTIRDIGYDVSACFIQPARAASLIPQESWLTPAIETWCRTQSDAHLAVLPAAERPVPTPVAPPPPGAGRKTQTD